MPAKWARAFLLLFFASSLFAAQRWNVQYFYDENKSALTITDLKFPSAKRGIASGFITEKEDKIRPVVLVTSDGGAHWALESVKEPGISLFFLDDSLGWMVTQKGIWQTEESGRSWRKLKLPKEVRDIAQVWFLDRQHGWAIGGHKAVLETTDAGVTWTPVAAAAEPKANPEYTTYGCIFFANGKTGVISGWNSPPRREGPVPEWMDPQNARKRRQWPTMSLFLQTGDGGKTWESSTASLFGRLTRMSFSRQGVGLGLMEFNDEFEWPSEVYRVNGQTGKSTRAFREKNRWITDVLVTDGGPAYIAGIEPVGPIRPNPIPGKLKVLKSSDLNEWEEMAVDYRAEAHRAILAGAEGNAWVATDTGMILKLGE